MFNTVAIEIVTSLVLVYLIYSLFATILGEMISTWIGLRARLLRLAVERMLNDGFYETNGHKRVQVRGIGDHLLAFLQYLVKRGKRFILFEHKDFKKSFAGRFYEYPSIKYLSRLESEQRVLFSSTKPSYITADNFADTLFNLLQSKGLGELPMEKIQYCLEKNVHELDGSTLIQLRDLFNAANNNPQVFKDGMKKWFTEVMDRTTGWYKHKMQFILFTLGMLIVIIFNVDTIQIAQKLSKDDKARDQLIAMSIAMAKDSAHRFDSIYLTGNDSVRLSQQLIDSSYKAISRDMQNANMILGIGWQLDTLQDPRSTTITKKKDAKTYHALLQFMQETDHTQKTIEQLKKAYASSDSLYHALETNIHLQKRSILNSAATGDTLSSKDTAGFYLLTPRLLSATQLKQADSMAYVAQLKQQIPVHKSIAAITGEHFAKVSRIDKVDSTGITITGTEPYSAFGKAWFVVSEIPADGKRLLGWIITALALTLGAPFWFDLLKKLVNLRNAGIKPEEKVAPPIPDPLLDLNPVDINLAAPPVINTEPIEPVDKALMLYKDSIMRMEGVLAVNKWFYEDDETGETKKGVHVLVNNERVGANVIAKYHPIIINDTIQIPVIVDVVNKPHLLGNTPENTPGVKELALTNTNRPANWGTISCVVKKFTEPNNEYLLSCYHVFNGDYTWQNDDKHKNIMDFRRNVIAVLDNAALTTNTDSAIALIKDPAVATFYKTTARTIQPRNIRDVSEDDIFTTNVVIEGFSTPMMKGRIIHTSFECPIPYLQSKGGSTFMHMFKNLIIIQHNDPQFPQVSTNGDSGSLVLDSQQVAIGIVVATDDKFTYAVKIKQAFRPFGVYLSI
ncbi:hypothetical protein LX64_02152 [Chitinophaga skermanii]|uniref:Uncharacterized protein n=1 Tax=Chitinophaga skermanii TaxID=331697 RepID=A0A327QUD7_9BACT|nr:hypothetical protein [Chitinophaga skermanii]RAJ07023.1 hypothetical protein LX64_02152 [Chitinophaga skermanii]